MKIEFREVTHQFDETHMGHKIFSTPAMRPTPSLQQQIQGFTPLTAIARYFGWDSNLFTKRQRRVMPK